MASVLVYLASEWIHVLLQIAMFLFHYSRLRLVDGTKSSQKFEELIAAESEPKSKYYSLSTAKKSLQTRLGNVEFKHPSKAYLLHVL